MGNVKRLELWQLYLTSLPERDVRNIRPLYFCWTECTCTWSRSTALWFVNKHAKRISAVFVTWPSQAESRHVTVGARSRTESVPACRWMRRFWKKGLAYLKKNDITGRKWPFNSYFTLILLSFYSGQLYLVNRAVSLECLWFVTLKLFWPVGRAGATTVCVQRSSGQPQWCRPNCCCPLVCLRPVRRWWQQFWSYTYFWNAPISGNAQSL